jgi:hypothetical protein
VGPNQLHQVVFDHDLSAAGSRACGRKLQIFSPCCCPWGELYIELYMSLTVRQRTSDHSGASSTGAHCMLLVTSKTLRPIDLNAGLAVALLARLNAAQIARSLCTLSVHSAHTNI